MVEIGVKIFQKEKRACEYGNITKYGRDRYSKFLKT